MSWVKLDDGFTEHPKVLEAGEDAAWMFVAGLAYCNRNPSNQGFIPAGQVPRLTLKKNPMELARRLVACGEPIGKVGLWEEVAGGYRIHDYEQFQPTDGASPVSTEDRSAAKREAGRKGGQATQRRSPQVANNLKQHRSSTEAASPKHAEADTEADESEAPPKHLRSTDPPKHTEAHRSPVPVPVPVLRSRVGEHAHVGATPARTLGFEAVVDDATTRHDGGARVGGGARTWTGADLDEAWRSTYRRPTGAPGDVSQLAGLVREAAELRGEQPAELGQRFLDEFKAMLGEWKARSAHHGTPQVTDAIKHFGKVLDRLEADEDADEQPDNPAFRRFKPIKRPAKVPA